MDSPNLLLAPMRHCYTATKQLVQFLFYICVSMKYSLFLLCVFSCLTSNAQRQQDFFALNQVVKATPYTGKKIRLQASVRMDALDSAAKTGLWMRVDETDHKIGFFRNTWDEPTPSSAWKTVTIEGHVTKKAHVIVFGALFRGKGQFYFDDFRLSIFNNGKWEPILLIDPSFEDTATRNDGWIFTHTKERLPLSFTTLHPVAGAMAFAYDGKNNATEPTYGANTEAGKFADINDIRVYYEVYGQGEPLLLLHGNGQNIGEFEQQIDLFKEKYKVIAVDTRGQGKSTTDTSRYTYHLFAKDMYELLNQLGLDSVNILGWSDGGNTGLIMAMQYPEKVKRLATMGANIFINTDAIKAPIFREINKQLKQLGKDTSAKALNDRRLMHLLLEEPNMKFEDLSTIHCPVLVMAGENDLIREQHTRGIAQHIAGAQLVIFPKGTHYIPQENAPLFNKTVLEFLKK